MNHEHSVQKEGPGTWYSMHLMAKRATTPENKIVCIHFINAIREEFFCLNPCRNHFNQYCSMNPLPDIYNSGPKDFFKWTVDAHNNANRLTGKPIMSYEKAESLYYGSDSFCTAGCDSETQNSNIPRPFSMAVRMNNTPIPKGFK